MMGLKHSYLRTNDGDISLKFFSHHFYLFVETQKYGGDII